MNSSDDSIQPTSVTEELPQPSFLPPQSSSTMQEYNQLQQWLLLITLALSGIIFISVWIVYSLNIALNYLIGACTGVVYLKMLARDVEQLGRQKQRLSKTRFAVLIGVLIVASQWGQLQILPIFLGFLTYKATLIVYMVQSLMPPDRH
ncbi:MAG TPA: ATP synthase subunit I [Candidatus Sericytochromatia bacterium]|nr:ATP synthase subunit I [Cyanobacteriota bacterium]